LTDREEQEMENLPTTSRTDLQDRADTALKVIKTSARMIAVAAVIARAAAAVLAVIARVAEAMADRQIDSAVSQQLRALRQKLLPRIWKRSVRKKRDVSAKRRTREIVRT